MALERSLTTASLAPSLSAAYVQQAPAGDATHSSIPFKTAPTPLEDSGPRVGGAMLLFAILVIGGLYLVRKRFPQLSALQQSKSKRLRVVERLRLTPRTTVYLLELDQKEILIGHSGDRLVRLDTRSAEELQTHEPAK